MQPEIKIISLSMPLFQGANCYLVKTETGYILIDTGFARKRAEVEQALASAGCRPGDLPLIVITHGDKDHTGNCAYLREKYSTREHPVKIAMHHSESGVVESGDEAQSRSKPPLLVMLIGGIIIKLLAAIINMGKFARFKPDLCLDEGDHLSGYGLDARILLLPGHSRGSIGILATVDGSATRPTQVLFCGDLLMNVRKPGPHFIVDDAAQLKASIERVKSLGIETVYPGHGKPFRTEQLMTSNQ